MNSQKECNTIIVLCITFFLVIIALNIGVILNGNTSADTDSDRNVSENANIMPEERNPILAKAEEDLNSLFEEQTQNTETKNKDADETQNAEDSSDELSVLEMTVIFLSLLMFFASLILILCYEDLCCEVFSIFDTNIIKLCGQFFMKTSLIHTLNKEKKRYNQLHIEDKEISLKISLLQAGINNISYKNYFCPELDEILPTKITSREILKKDTVTWRKDIQKLYEKQGMSPECMQYSISFAYWNYYVFQSLPKIKADMIRFIDFIHADIDWLYKENQPVKEKKKDIKTVSETSVDISGLVLYQQQILSFIRTCPDDYAQIWAEILSQIKMLQNIMTFKKNNYLEGIGNIEFRIENAIEKFNNYLNLKNFEGAINSAEFENLSTNMRTYLKNTIEMIKKANQEYMSSDVYDLDIAIRAGLISEDGELKYYKRNTSM